MVNLHRHTRPTPDFIPKRKEIIVAKAKPKKTTKSKAKTETGAPSIVVMKGGKTAAQLFNEVNLILDEPMTNAQKRDFMISLEQVVTDELAEGNPVNLFGLVKIVPRLHTKGERMVNSEFGNPESPKVKKKYSAKVSLKAGQGIFSKKVKGAMPTVQKLQKRV